MPQHTHTVSDVHAATTYLKSDFFSQVEEGSDEGVRLAKEGAAYMLEANAYYMTNGNYDRALEAIQKAAKVSQTNDPSQAIKHYMMLGTVTPMLDKAGQVLAIDALREGFQFAIRNGSYDEARQILDLFRQFTEELQQYSDLKRACLSTVILHLASGDGPAAEASANKLARQHPCFAGTDDFDCALDILSAYADKDEEALKKQKKNERVLMLDPSLIRVFAGMHADGAKVDGSYSTKQVLDLGNDEPDSPTSGGGELDLGGYAPPVKKKAPEPADDDLC